MPCRRTAALILVFIFCRRFLDLLLQEKYFTLFTAPAGIINLKLNIRI